MLEEKMKSVVSKAKVGIAALAAVGLMGIASCGSEDIPCDKSEVKYNYCNDYAGQYRCESTQRCVCSKASEGSSCECHCVGHVDKGY
ncbi:MAG: hypothetical protein AABX04_01120 [Nanoarchaeota archaeon]